MGLELGLSPCLWGELRLYSLLRRYRLCDLGSWFGKPLTSLGGGPVGPILGPAFCSGGVALQGLRGCPALLATAWGDVPLRVKYCRVPPLAADSS